MSEEAKDVLKQDFQNHQNVINNLYFTNKTAEADLFKVMPEGMDFEIILESLDSIYNFTSAIRPKSLTLPLDQKTGFSFCLNPWWKRKSLISVYPFGPKKVQTPTLHYAPTFSSLQHRKVRQHRKVLRIPNILPHLRNKWPIRKLWFRAKICQLPIPQQQTWNGVRQKRRGSRQLLCCLQKWVQ